MTGRRSGPKAAVHSVQRVALEPHVARELPQIAKRRPLSGPPFTPKPGRPKDNFCPSVVVVGRWVVVVVVRSFRSFVRSWDDHERPWPRCPWVLINRSVYDIQVRTYEYHRGAVKNYRQVVALTKAS